MPNVPRLKPGRAWLRGGDVSESCMRFHYLFAPAKRGYSHVYLCFRAILVSMADHLHLFVWLRGYSTISMLPHFGKMLAKFPIPPQNPANSVLRIEAIAPSEPPVLERPLPDPVDTEEVVAIANEYLHEDCAYILETWWGLWQQRTEREWELKPARITLSCYGPTYERVALTEEAGEPEHFSIDFGLESSFLPDLNNPESIYYCRSNLKGLLRFVQSLDDTLPVERRRLWSESGGNFAERLEAALRDRDD